MQTSTVLVTGSSGFVGFHTAQQLLQQWYRVIGIDNENDYYSPALKLARREVLLQHPAFVFIPLDISDKSKVEAVFVDYKPTIVIHLAAQAGVRYSITHPDVYVASNLTGFFNVLDVARLHNVERFVYASSSSVYGNSLQQPSHVHAKVDAPISLYAATKKSNELVAHTYSTIYGIPTLGLRFFTVYGPWGRPDMAIFSFTQKILANQPIDVYNYGQMKRDFTYIDDIVEGIIKGIDAPTGLYAVCNLWNDTPEQLENMIDLLWKHLWKDVKKNYLPLQPGDVISTRADIEHTKELLNRQPKTSLDLGLKKFVDRYLAYHQ